MKFYHTPLFPILLIRTGQASVIGMALHWFLHWPLVGSHALGLFLAPLLCLYFVFVFYGAWHWGLPILTHLPTRENRVALTFDDGPSLENTPAIIEILKAHGVTATFFMLGKRVETHAELVEEVITAGHAVGIHAYRHHSLALASLKKVQETVTKTELALRSASPAAPNIAWVRPPFGFKSIALPFFIRICGRHMAAWSINSRDYTDSSPEQIATNVLHNLHPGAIVLMHDGPTNAATTRALPLILDGLRARGYVCNVLP